MDLYTVRGKLIDVVSEKINEGKQRFINKYSADNGYNLLYPLIDIEKALENSAPENIHNVVRREVFGYMVEMTSRIKRTNLYKYNLNNNGFEDYQHRLYDELYYLERDNRTLFEIKDGSSFAKSLLEKKSDNEYRLLTSLVSNTEREEDFYFYGLDDEKKAKEEIDMIQEGINKFYYKYLINPSKYNTKIDRLPIDIDVDLLTYSRTMVMKDLDKLPSKVRSQVFKSTEELGNVLSYLYYLAFVRKMRLALLGSKVTKNGKGNVALEDYLIIIDKQWFIDKTSKLYGMHEAKIFGIVKYLTNNGSQQILEFPLFIVDDLLVTIPSFIMVNDWQFTIVNGHYFKGIEFKNKNKTISISTQNKLKKAVELKENILFVEEKYYEYNENGTSINSDIDFAIYSVSQNVLLVIEAKWKENHYYNESEKRFINLNSASTL